MIFLLSILIFLSKGYFIIEPSTPFDLSSQQIGYVQTGKFCPQNQGCVDGNFILDNKNNRMAFHFGIYGTWVSMNNATYVWGQILIPQCAIMTGFTFQNQQNGWSNAFSMIGSTQLFSNYFGSINDMASCQHGQSINIFLQNNFIFLMMFSQDVPVPISQNQSICFRANQYFQGLSISFPNDLSSYFQLRSDCLNNPIDYCNATYPPGNPCIISQ